MTYGGSVAYSAGVAPTASQAPTTAPAAPTITLTPGAAQVSVAWTDGATNGAAITSHKLYRGTVSGSRTLVGTISTASPYVDTGLTNGTAYFYSLSAVNSAGEGPQSAQATATPVVPAAGLDLVIIGDSISTATDPSNGNIAGVPSQYMTVAQTYPEVLKTRIQFKQGSAVNITRIAISGKGWNYNYGSGQTLNQMVQDATNGFSALIPSSRRAAAKVILFAGTNDIALNSGTDVNTYAGLTTCIDYLVSQGVTASNIAVITMLPRFGSGGGQLETYRVGYNNLIKADGGGRGYQQVRIDESLGFDDQGDNSSYAFKHDYPNSSVGDQIHPGWMGQKIIGHMAYDGGHYAGGTFPNATFDPIADLPNPLVFDPADYNASTGNWPSKTGSAVSVTLAQATAANRPTLSTLNGLPAVSFPNGAGASTRAWLRATSTGYAAPLFDSAVAYKANSYQSNGFIFNWGDSVNGWDTGMKSYFNSTTQYNQSRAVPDTTLPHVYEALYPSAASGSVGARSFIDGAWAPTNTSSHPTSGVAATATDLTVGGANQYNANFGNLDGLMGQLIFWQPPDANDYWVLRTKRYLKERYGTP